MQKAYLDMLVQVLPDGTLLPRAFMWNDERIRIDRVKQIKSGISSGILPENVDRYTIIVNGQERNLYFEKQSDRMSTAGGRRYVVA